MMSGLRYSVTLIESSPPINAMMALTVGSANACLSLLHVFEDAFAHNLTPSVHDASL